MSAGFTPGPWTASVEAKSFAAGGHWYVVTDSEENGIGEFYGDDHEANAANLHLAAAAPELYEQLSGVVNFLNKAIERNFFTFDGEALAGAIAERASVTLAKATNHAASDARPSASGTTATPSGAGSSR